MAKIEGPFNLIEYVHDLADDNKFTLKSLTVLGHIFHVIYETDLDKTKKFEPFLFYGYNEKTNESALVYGAIYVGIAVEHITEFKGSLSEKVLKNNLDLMVNRIPELRKEIFSKMDS